jgi:hypothetical protein
MKTLVQLSSEPQLAEVMAAERAAFATASARSAQVLDTDFHARTVARSKRLVGMPDAASSKCDV